MYSQQNPFHSRNRDVVPQSRRRTPYIDLSPTNGSDIVLSGQRTRVPVGRTAQQPIAPTERLVCQPGRREIDESTHRIHAAGSSPRRFSLARIDFEPTHDCRFGWIPVSNSTTALRIGGTSLT